MAFFKGQWGFILLLYLIKRLLLLIPVLFTVGSLVFFLLRLTPGNPVDFILGENANPADRQALIEQAHFDQPVLNQYVHYWKDIVSGSWGYSYFTHKPVSKMIMERYPATLELALLAVFWACFFSLFLGLFTALKQGSLWDKLGLVFSLVGVSVPSFYLGPLLVLLFAIKLDWFPVSGRELPGSFWLPSLALGGALAAILTRMMRSSLIEVLKADYVRTAHAKGVSQFWVLVKHALRTALLPVVAILGMQFGTLLAGAVVTEKIFSWPGLGSLLLEAISRRDYAVVQGCILVIATTYVLVNVLTDLVYTKIDPRIKL